jgi:hypothetical protein
MWPKNLSNTPRAYHGDSNIPKILHIKEPSERLFHACIGVGRKVLICEIESATCSIDTKTILNTHCIKAEASSGEVCSIFPAYARRHAGTCGYCVAQALVEKREHDFRRQATLRALGRATKWSGLRY